MRVDVRRPGLRALYAGRYSIRSPEERKRSRLLAAWAAPGMFSGGVVRTHLFAVGPASPKRWSAQLVMEFPVALVGNRVASADYDFGAVLRSGSRVVHRFDRRIHLESRSGEPLPDRKVSFIQDVELEPGPYDLRFVLSDASGETVFAHQASVQLPEIPRGEPFLVGPLLGRRASRNLVVRSEARREGKTLQDDPARDRVGSSRAFDPLLVYEVDKGEPLVALTLACLVSSREDPNAPRLERLLLRADGTAAGMLAPKEVDFRSTDRVRCERLLDVLPVASLRPGPYRFEARLDPEPEEAPGESSVPFAVVVPGE